ncbi:MAG: 4'-phosphopantetheinyl transferase superfamily protein [Sphingomonadales bacterium]|jgi:phosphopantetheinyl transferase
MTLPRAAAAAPPSCGPLWRDGTWDCRREQWTGPLCLITRPDSAAAVQLMAGATLSPRDLGDFAGRADAAFRLARRRLVKALLAWAAGVHPDAVRLARSALGAPVVTAPGGWFVSVSGQGPLCLVGLAREPIGVDIEPCTAPPPPRDLMTPRERDWLARLPATEAAAEALAFWVAKEAHAKRTGLARQMEPGDVEMVRTAQGLRASSAGHISRCWTFAGHGAVAAAALGTVQPMAPPDGVGRAGTWPDSSLRQRD